MGFFLLLIYAVMLLIRPHEWVFVGMEEVPIIRYCLLASIGIFLMEKKKNLFTPQVPIMIMLGISIIMSMLVSGYIGGLLDQVEEFIQINLVPFLLINAFVNTPSRIRAMFVVSIITSLIAVSDGHVQISSSDGLGWTGNLVYSDADMRRINYVGYMNDPNDLGMFLVMSIPLIMYFFVRMKNPMRYVLLGFIAFILYGIYLTNSRGTLLATMGLVGFWFFNKYGLKKSLYMGVLGLPALLLVMSQFREIDAEEESAQGRIEAWYEGYQMFFGSPLFGVGKDGFIDNNPITAHNSFVLAFSELGFFGCVAWIALLYSTFRVLFLVLDYYQRLKTVPGTSPGKLEKVAEEAQIATTLIYSMIGFCISCFFLSRTYIPFLYLFVAMASSTYARMCGLAPELRKKLSTRQLIVQATGLTAAGMVGTFVMVRALL